MGDLDFFRGAICELIMHRVFLSARTFGSCFNDHIFGVEQSPDNMLASRGYRLLKFTWPTFYLSIKYILILDGLQDKSCFERWTIRCTNSHRQYLLPPSALLIFAKQAELDAPFFDWSVEAEILIGHAHDAALVKDPQLALVIGVIQLLYLLLLLHLRFLNNLLLLLQLRRLWYFRLAAGACWDEIFQGQFVLWYISCLSSLINCLHKG